MVESLGGNTEWVLLERTFRVMERSSLVGLVTGRISGSDQAVVETLISVGVDVVVVTGLLSVS